jgi:hypothetical protein
VEQILRSYGIVAGKDFQLDVLKRKTPTGIFRLLGDEPQEQSLFSDKEMGADKD